MKHVTIIGTQGVPANYGGFESLVENLIGEHKSEDVKYTVFCSARDTARVATESERESAEVASMAAELSFLPS